MGYLKQIDVENFKSWRGKQVIGPFMRFNCIIGSNGSGKSNVMDAMSFAMGERVASLRVRRTTDLIHGAHIGQPVSHTASVAMRYCQDDGEETVFCRSISGDSSEYRVNAIHVTLAKYLEELEKIGIITKARNCLVFQGAVESIAMKDPKERTKMFERISQSLDYADDYEKRRGALMKAKEDTQFHFNMKKSAAFEMKQVSHEKIEAQKYQELVDELNQRRLQLSLFELYHNEKSIGALSDTLKEKQQVTAAKGRNLEALEQSMRAHKKEHGRLTREQQHIEKEIRAQEQILSLRQPQYIKVVVNTSHHMKKAEEVRAALQKGQKLMVKKKEELAESRQEIAELERAWKSYERQVQEEQAAQLRGIQLAEDQVGRYELKELARKRVALLSQQAEKLHWDVTADREKIAFDERRKKEVEVVICAVCLRASLQDYCQQEASLSEKLQWGCQRSEEVNKELGQVLEELGNAHLDTQESRRHQQRKEVMERLRRLYPETVYGRVVDLCSPIHKKYQLAVTKVFGCHMNDIVVSSEKVARECICFLKEERAEPETFLPIDNLVVRPLNERLREIRGAKMVVDVVQCSSALAAFQLKKVIEFVCGNAVVCETIEEARRVAFHGRERIKTVALDGSLFTKSGVISGGSRDLRTKARRWDQKDMTRLKERRDQLTAELHGLMKLRRKTSELKQIQAQAHGAQTNLKYSNIDLENLRKNICNFQEISCMERQLANLESEIQMQHDSVELKDMEDLVFADFCAEIGINNIREYENEHLKQQTELDKKRLEYESHRTRLCTQLEYEQEQLEQQKQKLQKLKDTITKVENTVAEQKKVNISESLMDTHWLRKKHYNNNRASHCSSARALMNTWEKAPILFSSRELVKLQREVISVEMALEQKRLARHNLLLACKIQSLPISLLSGNLNEISEVQVGHIARMISKMRHQKSGKYCTVCVCVCVCVCVQRLESEEDVEAQQVNLRESVSSIEEVLHRTTAPSLKALEEMRDVKENYQGVVEAFDASTRVAKRCNQEFERVKTQRFHRFSQCFEHVSVVIDQIYKRICRNTGAQAVLSAENPEEPYLGGISYSCVAPGKRFMAMEDLSGGEKAIAALALVFAIHSFRPAPFFVLDEVDAALDNTNINKVTSFIREESRQNMQIIVISLKEEFFSRADALLGVYSDVSAVEQIF
uniref:Structural maintenance of chromosomes protein n=1 Tax=Myripristis murdjan TaxID=586833 RepID=A0A667YJS6_9TELE